MKEQEAKTKQFEQMVKSQYDLKFKQLENTLENKTKEVTQLTKLSMEAQKTQAQNARKS